MDGIYLVPGTDRADRLADIVFVRGLGGGSHSTWTVPSLQLTHRETASFHSVAESLKVRAFRIIGEAARKEFRASSETIAGENQQRAVRGSLIPAAARPRANQTIKTELGGCLIQGTANAQRANPTAGLRSDPVGITVTPPNASGPISNN